jgi:hypothetical protein
LLVSGTVFIGSAARAGASSTGGGVLTGTGVEMGAPCQQMAGCQSPFTGSVTLSLAGVGMGVVNGLPAPYAAAWVGGLNNFSVQLTIIEPCMLEPIGAPPMFATAGGNFTLSGGTLTYPGGTLSGATLSGAMKWSRSGTAVTMSLTNLTITSALGSVSLASTISGVGVAGFAYTSVPPGCGGQPVNQGFALSGIALQAV